MKTDASSQHLYNSFFLPAKLRNFAQTRKSPNYQTKIFGRQIF
jgi:hypothetical protein